MRFEPAEAFILAQKPPPELLATLEGHSLAIRDGLRDLFDQPLLRDLDETMRGTAEIVLAEALNNIVEHAYRVECGKIEIHLRRKASEILVAIRDAGLPMPCGALPAGQLRQLVPGADLPEGGFGWFLIRTLAQDLRYCRADGFNLLSFRLVLN